MNGVRQSDARQKAWRKVTVVIVNWNGEPYLERCLSALIAQTVKPHEIILVDNPSSDRSLEIARQFSVGPYDSAGEEHWFYVREQSSD